MTKDQIKKRALELAAAQLGAEKITRIGASFIRQAEKAASEAIDKAIVLALVQHRRSSKTLVATICDPIPPNTTRRITR